MTTSHIYVYIGNGNCKRTISCQRWEHNWKLPRTSQERTSKNLGDACFRETTRKRNKIHRNERRAPKKESLRLKCQIWRVEKDDGRKRRIPDAKGKKYTRRREDWRPGHPAQRTMMNRGLMIVRKRTSPEISSAASHLTYRPNVSTNSMNTL